MSTVIEAEAAFLGALLVDPERAPELVSLVAPDEMLSENHKAIYEAMLSILRRGDGLDLVMLRNELGGSLMALGGHSMLVRIEQAATSSALAKAHARIVRDASRLRRLRVALLESAEQVSGLTPGTSESAEAQNSVQATLDGILNTRSAAVVEPTHAILSRVVNDLSYRDNSKTSLKTGLRDLDALLGGLRPGDMCVVAARPGMGKTALGTCIARHVAGREGSVFLASLEMSRDAMWARLLCSEAGAPLARVRAMGATQSQAEALRAAEAVLGGLALMVDDTPAQTLAGLKANLLAWRRKRGLSLVIVDYLQLLRIPEYKRDRYREVTEVSLGLKTLARELGVPVIAMSQLSREVEKREDKQPLLSDLRESGAIEQDADSVLFVYRAEYYQQGDDEGMAKIIVAKNRNGPTGHATVLFDGELMKFCNPKFPTQA